MTHEPRAGRLRFEASDLAARADEAAVRMDLMMPDLTRAHAVSKHELPVRDDAAADPRAERDGREILRPLTAPVDVFTERRRASVVEDMDALAELSLERRTERRIFPLEVRRPADGARPFVDVARRADADALDFAALQRRSRFTDGRADAFDDVVEVVRLEIVLETFADLPAIVDGRRHDMRSAEIDADCPSHQRTPKTKKPCSKRAQDRTRTCTGFTRLAPQTSASTNSATWA